MQHSPSCSSLIQSSSLIFLDFYSASASLPLKLTSWIILGCPWAYSLSLGIEIANVHFFPPGGTKGLIRPDIQSLSFHGISLGVLAITPQRTVIGIKSVLDAGNPGPTQRVINRAGGGGRRARVSVIPPEARRWTAELFLLAPSSLSWHRQITPPLLPHTLQTVTFPLLSQL